MDEKLTDKKSDELEEIIRMTLEISSEIGPTNMAVCLAGALAAQADENDTDIVVFFDEFYKDLREAVE